MIELFKDGDHMENLHEVARVSFSGDRKCGSDIRKHRKKGKVGVGPLCKILNFDLKEACVSCEP